MENIVQCKICKSDFDYNPGYAGNARMLCNQCRIDEDKKEIETFKEKLIVEGNQYLANDSYDPADILLLGVVPEFKCDAEKFKCAVAVGKFVIRTGITGIEENLATLLKNLGSLHCILLLHQLNLATLEQIAKDERFKFVSIELLKLL